MKLSEWVRKNGLSYPTAHKLFKEGNLPVRSQQLPTGTILIYEDEEVVPSNRQNIIYARVSSI